MKINNNSNLIYGKSFSNSKFVFNSSSVLHVVYEKNIKISFNSNVFSLLNVTHRY